MVNYEFIISFHSNKGEEGTELITIIRKPIRNTLTSVGVFLLKPCFHELECSRILVLAGKIVMKPWFQVVK